MKSQGRASEPAQAKIGTRRLEEQPEKGKAVETADSPVRHTVRLTTADREVTIPVFLFRPSGSTRRLLLGRRRKGAKRIASFFFSHNTRTKLGELEGIG